MRLFSILFFDMSVQQRLQQQLQQAFQPQHVQVENESHMHGGAPRDPQRVRETHFKAVLVSDAFIGLRLAQRHQRVYQALGSLMEEVHALGLHTFTIEEWAARSEQAPASPPCSKAPSA